MNEKTDIMNAFFSGKIGTENIHSEPKRVELGYGIGIGNKGSYSQYIQKLSEQSQKGNGIIYLGKDIIKNDNIYDISNPTDKFTPKDIPTLLIMYYNILKDIRIKIMWKDSENDTILEQYYDIPSAHSNNYDWWDTYAVYFNGPEDLDYGDYGAEIISYQLGYDNKISTYKTEIKFSIEDIDETETDNTSKQEKEKTASTELLGKTDSDIKKANEDIKKVSDKKVNPDIKKSNEDIDVYEAFGMR